MSAGMSGPLPLPGPSYVSADLFGLLQRVEFEVPPMRMHSVSSRHDYPSSPFNNTGSALTMMSEVCFVVFACCGVLLRVRRSFAGAGVGDLARVGRVRRRGRGVAIVLCAR